MNYSYKIEQEITGIRDKLRCSYDIVDSYFIHKGICPSCNAELKQYRGEISEVGLVGAFVPKDDSTKVIMYCLCKSCGKKIKNRDYTATSNADMAIIDYLNREK